MGAFSPVHWLLYLIIFAVLFGFPVFKILQKAGFSGWWAILTFLPFINWIGLWVFAFMRWPNARASSDKSAGDVF
jgi:hypothetical protein